MVSPNPQMESCPVCRACLVREAASMIPNFTLQALVRRFFPEELAEREEELIKEVLGRINSISKEKAAAEAASSNRGNRANRTLNT
jgi:hypothetical protein